MDQRIPECRLRVLANQFGQSEVRRKKMAEVKYSGKSPEQRISDRLKSSGAGTNPDVMVKKGESPNRTITHIHHSGAEKRRDKDTNNG
jgi:hypothetical protein